MDTQTEAQRQRALLDAGLTPTQQAGVTAGTGYSINSSVLQPQPEIKLPTPQQDTTNYSGMISGGQATIDQYNKDVQKGIDDALKEQQNANPSLIDQYLKSSTAPTELTGQYQTAVAGLAPQEQAVATENVALKSAQAKLRDVNARLAGINAEAQAIPIRLQEDATGRGITKGGLAPIEAGELRKVALRALPLQAEAIAAQAEVQTAQGNVELAQNTLKLAQDKLNTAFQLYTKDAENKYNYQKDLRDKVYAYATEKEKQKLDALQREDDRDFQFMRDQINNAQSLAKTAMENGQASLAAQITALDPNSRSYVTDLAELQGQIIPKPGNALSGAPTSYKEWELAGKPGTYANWLKEQNIKAPTVAQQTVAEYAARIEQSIPTLEKLTSAVSKMNPLQFEAQLRLSPRFQSPEIQQYMQAASNFINAKLRRESGAVISPSEFVEARSQYLPVPGNDAETLKQKKANRDLVFASLRKAAGNAYESVEDLLAQDQGVNGATVGAGKPGTIEYPIGSGKKYSVDAQGNMTPL